MAKAMEYFDTSFHHAKKHEVIRGTGTYHYSALLISKVTVTSDKWPKAPVNLWKGWLKIAPENLIEAIR